jgi:hypothetical protein
MSTGILMIAMGHENYIKMAVNLAMSIKASSKVDIHLIHNGGYYDLSTEEQVLFASNAIPVDELWNTNDKQDLIKPKTRLYELSPFDKTLFLDVDMIWLFRPIDELLNELNGVEFAIMNTGPEEKCYWADLAELRQVTKSEHPMYVFYSELLYFEKNANTKAFFKQVRQNYDKPKVKSKQFAGSHMPDELAYIMASLQTGMLPHQDNWLPVYWYLRDKKHRHLQPYQLTKIFYGYSIGGNVTPQYAKAHYNNLSTHFANAMGMKKPYQVRDKRSYIPERQKY